MQGIDQTSSIQDMMAYAGFKRRGSRYYRTVQGVEYVAEAFDGKAVTDPLNGVFVSQSSNRRAGFRSYETLLEMALTWKNAPSA